jgi:hypothetical protein
MDRSKQISLLLWLARFIHEQPENTSIGEWGEVERADFSFSPEVTSESEEGEVGFFRVFP